MFRCKSQVRLKGTAIISATIRAKSFLKLVALHCFLVFTGLRRCVQKVVVVIATHIEVEL
jgi:hypothetical protein